MDERMRTVLQISKKKWCGWLDLDFLILIIDIIRFLRLPDADGPLRKKKKKIKKEVARRELTF